MSRLEVTSPGRGRDAGVGAGGPGDRVVSGSLLSAGEVAQLLGVPVSWVYEQSRRGRIPTVTLGRYRRYRREAIEEWLMEIERRSS
jgi:excisionase family DNA binding protein